MRHLALPLSPARRPRLLLACLATLALLAACGSDGQEPSSSDPSGGISSSGTSGDGGTGTAPPPTAPEACGPAMLDGQIEGGAWDAAFTIPGITGLDGFTPAVHSIVDASDGTLRVSGYFRWAGGEAVPSMATLSEGELSAYGDDRGLTSVAVTADGPGGQVALATNIPLLPSFPPTPQTGEIYLEDGEGSLEELGTFSGIVRAMAWVGDTLWVGGRFALEGHGISNLALWTEGEWSLPPGGAANGPVYTFLRDGEDLWVGGSFSRFGEVNAQSVARWDGEAWSARDIQLGPQQTELPFVGPIVYGLALDDEGTLYAAGVIYPQDEWTAGGIAQWTGSEWEILGSGLALSGGFGGDLPAVIADIAVFQGQLYAGGCFHRRGDEDEDTYSLSGVARWNGVQWEALPSASDAHVSDFWFNQGVCGGEPSGTAILEAPIQVLHSTEEMLYFGGHFAGFGGTFSKGLIGYDGSEWVALGDMGGEGLAGYPAALAVGGPECMVHAFGGISHAGDASGSVLYRFDGTSWEGVTDALPEEVSCSGLAVSPQGEIVLGCATPFEGFELPSPVIYRLTDAMDWVSIGTLEATGTFELGKLLFDADDVLWAVGGIGEEGFVARWDGDEVEVLDAVFDGGVMSIALGPDHRASAPQIVVGGGFASVSGVEVNGVAAWDGAQWSPLGSGVATQQTPVLALAWAESYLYASSSSSGGSDDAHAILARWDGTSWEEMGVPTRGLPAPVEGTTHQFTHLLASGDTVVAAGHIWPASQERNVYIFDGESFSALGGGLGAGFINDLVAAPDAIWFGGSIATSGVGEDMRPTVGVGRYLLAP